MARVPIPDDIYDFIDELLKDVRDLKIGVVGLQSTATPELLSGSMKISELRTTSGTMAVGANAFALDLTGITAPGIVVVAIAPATHHTWTWYPHPGLGGVLFNNSGASQSVTVKYHVVGT